MDLKFQFSDGEKTYTIDELNAPKLKARIERAVDKFLARKARNTPPPFDREAEHAIDLQRRKEMTQRLRTARLAANMRQVDLANKIGTNQAAITNYETGRLDISTAHLFRLARALNVTTDWLLGLTDDKN